MAVYVSFKQAIKFPVVIAKFGNASRMWKKLKETGAAFARLPPSATQYGRQNAQVDVSAISVAANATLGRPGVVVPALKGNGKR
jgi:hypothetical protein